MFTFVNVVLSLFYCSVCDEKRIERCNFIFVNKINLANGKYLVSDFMI